MFSRQEASQLKEEFWTAFGKYMSPVPSAEGLPINWVNYHTGLKDVHFRMDAGSKSAVIAITIEHRDPVIQQIYFEQFLEFQSLLSAMLNEEWIWRLHDQVNDRVISRIYFEQHGVSIFNKNDWPMLISFFKPRLITLDAFWENAKYTFDALR